MNANIQTMRKMRSGEDQGFLNDHYFNIKSDISFFESHFDEVQASLAYII